MEWTIGHLERRSTKNKLSEGTDNGIYETNSRMAGMCHAWRHARLWNRSLHAMARESCRLTDFISFENGLQLISEWRPWCLSPGEGDKEESDRKTEVFFYKHFRAGEQAHLSTPASSPVARSFSPSAQVFPARRSRPRERARKISGTKGSRVTYSPELKSPSNQYPLENCCFPIAAHTETTLPDWIYLSPLYLFEKQ